MKSIAGACLLLATTAQALPLDAPSQHFYGTWRRVYLPDDAWEPGIVYMRLSPDCTSRQGSKDLVLYSDRTNIRRIAYGCFKYDPSFPAPPGGGTTDRAGEYFFHSMNWVDPVRIRWKVDDDGSLQADVYDSRGDLLAPRQRFVRVE